MLDQKTSRRSGWIQRNAPDNGPRCNIQIDWTEMPWVGIKMWTATVDFTKVFHSISHKFIREALKFWNVDHEYVSFLRKIFRDQKASVQTDEESNIFDFQEGSKQEIRCPACLLFNTVFELSLQDEIQRWQKKTGMGMCSSAHDRDCFTNLRFADDVMLFAISKEQIRKMLCEFKKETEKVGFRIHPDERFSEEQRLRTSWWVDT